METRYQADFIFWGEGGCIFGGGREVVFFEEGGCIFFQVEDFAACWLIFLFLIQMNKSNPSEPCFPGLHTS